jgi:hypothetical protein
VRQETPKCAFKTRKIICALTACVAVEDGALLVPVAVGAARTLAVARLQQELQQLISRRQRAVLANERGLPEKKTRPSAVFPSFAWKNSASPAGGTRDLLVGHVRARASVAEGVEAGQQARLAHRLGAARAQQQSLQQHLPHLRRDLLLLRLLLLLLLHMLLLLLLLLEEKEKLPVVDLRTPERGGGRGHGGRHLAAAEGSVPGRHPRLQCSGCGHVQLAVRAELRRGSGRLLCFLLAWPQGLLRRQAKPAAPPFPQWDCAKPSRDAPRAA